MKILVTILFMAFAMSASAQADRRTNTIRAQFIRDGLMSTNALTDAQRVLIHRLKSRLEENGAITARTNRSMTIAIGKLVSDPAPISHLDHGGWLQFLTSENGAMVVITLSPKSSGKRSILMQVTNAPVPTFTTSLEQAAACLVAINQFKNSRQ